MMVIINCDKCGRKIHVGKFLENKCLFCHSPVEFEEPQNKSYEIVNRCEEQLSKGNLIVKSEDVVDMYDRFIDKYPNVSALYWGRLLARYSLKYDSQILSSGIRFIDDEDYLATYDCATDVEREYFDSISNIYKMLLQRVIKEAEKRKKSEIMATDIQQKQKDIYEKLKKLSEEFSSKIQELCNIEAKLKNQVVDCEVQYDCFRSIADSTWKGISDLKTDIGQKTEISDSKAFEYRMLMSRYFKTSEQILKETANFENSLMFEEYKSLLEQREKFRTAVLNLIEEIKNLDNGMQELITVIENIKSKYNKAIEQAKTKDYSSIASVFGDNIIGMLLDEVMKS